MTINIRMKVIFDTSEYILKLSTTFYCLKPLTSIALYLLIVPSTFIFLLKIHL